MSQTKVKKPTEGDNMPLTLWSTNFRVFLLNDACSEVGNKSSRPQNRSQQ